MGRDTLDAFAASMQLDYWVVLCDFLLLFFLYIWGKVRMKEEEIIETTHSELTGGEGL
jgi:hypothetical protein